MAKQKQLETMEEVINSIRRACELAQNLESALPNLANQPSMLSLSIDEITETLCVAKQRLLLISGQDQTSASSMMQVHDATLLQEWLRSSSHALTMDQMVQTQQLQNIGGEMGGRDVEDSKGSEGEVQAIEASPSRPRRREVDPEKRKVMLPAPLFGNTDMPPEDGFTWRKYGQKDILGSQYPRSYYRCTHQKLYECQAKKQVQRHDSNPCFFEVTYRGIHTCHMSITAPSPSPVPPPQQQLLDLVDSTHNSTPISSQLSPSMNLSLHAGGGGGGGGSGSGGPSTSRYGGDYPVVDMADAMFKSGSSSGNSMESLFPTLEDK